MKRKVLVVDDDEDVRRLVVLTLTHLAHHDVREVSNGEDAVSVVQQWAPDVVVLDVRMAVIDGPEVLSQLRADPRTRSVPVVFLTASARASERAELTRIGAHGVLEKPFDPVELPGSLDRLLGWQ